MRVCPQKGFGLGLMSCCFCLKVLNHFWTKGPWFSFCSGSYKLASWFCLWVTFSSLCWHLLLPDLCPLGTLLFSLYAQCPFRNSSTPENLIILLKSAITMAIRPINVLFTPRAYQKEKEKGGQRVTAEKGKYWNVAGLTWSKSSLFFPFPILSHSGVICYSRMCLISTSVNSFQLLDTWGFISKSQRIFLVTIIS